MKQLLSLCIVVCISLSLSAQEELYDMLSQGDVQTAYEKAKAGMAAKPDYALYYHVMGKVFADESFSEHNYVDAYAYFVDALRYYELTSAFEKRRYDKIPLNEIVINNDIASVSKKIVSVGRNTESIEYLNSFIIQFDKAPSGIQKIATYVRDSLAFDLAEKQDAIDGYSVYISTYSQSSFVKKAKARRDELAYNEAKEKKTKEGYKHFLDTYPEAKQTEEIQFAYDALFFDEMTEKGSYDSYLNFMKEFPNSSVVKYALKGMVDIAKEQNDVKLLRKAVAYSSNSSYAYALYEYYKVLTFDGEYQTIIQFVREFTNIPFLDVVKRDLQIAEMGENLEMHRGYIPERQADYIQYIKMAAPKDKAFVALQRLIAPDVQNKDWSRALARIATVEQFFGEKYAPIEELKRLITAEFDKSILVQEVPGEINTVDGGEYSPVLTLDSKTMYFCGKKRDDNIGGEDVFVSHFNDTTSEWGDPKLISKLSTTYSNDAPVSITSDGTTMIYFKEGVIHYAQKHDYGWGKGVEMPGKINDYQWSADAMISADGNALIFASIRPQNYNYFTDPSYVVPFYHGAFLHQSDIYVSPRTKDGWGEPINVGPVINTIYTDRSPFLHPDMKTLYFSSDGHGGFGAMDVFMSKRLADSCWDCWSKPVNLGKQINDHQDNWGYRITTDGKLAYFAARKQDKHDHDIFYVKVPEHVRPQKVTTIQGSLTNKSGVPIGATIIWEDLETGKEIGESQSDPETGEYIMALPHGKVYGYYVYDDKYYPLSHNIDLTNQINAETITQEMTAVSYTEMREEGESVRLNNLFFNTNESVILPNSIPELKRAAQIITKYNKKVEIAGHTDNVGAADFNVDLSLRRARAVRDFLVAEGCDPDLFVIEGFGLTKPIATNETVEGRAKNRRVELRFL